MEPRLIDTQIYREEILPWLPAEIIDCHAHVTLPEHMGPLSAERRAAIWAMEVGTTQSWEDLRDSYNILFPDQKVNCWVFGGVYREVDIEANNDYVLSGCGEHASRTTCLCVVRPEWSASRVAQELSRGFAGIKPYPDLACCDSSEISICDFVPREQLAALNQAGGILMLHLPREGRLGDPNNVRELLEIHASFPDIKLVVPHIGRSYCLPTAKRGLPELADTGVYFDTAANLNADVFQYALETVGPDRILFGSDLPVTLMRGTREHVGEQYVNYTDGPYAWNTNRRSPEEEAQYTFYLYEEIRALIKAVERAGLGRDAMDRIMYGNSARLMQKITAPTDAARTAST